MKHTVKILIVLLLSALVPAVAIAQTAAENEQTRLPDRIAGAVDNLTHRVAQDKPTKLLDNLQLKRQIRLRAIPQETGILLKWRAVAGCDDYRVYHETGDEIQRDSARIDIDSSQTAYLFREVTPGEHYTFRVAALFNGREMYLSTPITVKTRPKSAVGRSDSAK